MKSRRTRRISKGASKGFTLGRFGFSKISAIEGVELTPSMHEDFREFDRKGFSTDVRRRIIRAKYGKVR